MARKVSEGFSDNTSTSSPVVLYSNRSSVNAPVKRRSITKSFSRPKSKGVRDRPMQLSEKKLEDSCMKHLMSLLFGYSDHSSIYMTTIT